MKIALTNLCKTEDFAKTKYYQEALGFLKEENIDFIDFASGATTIERMVENFNQALDSDADLIWVIRGGLNCIQTLDKINWKKVVKSKKEFYGLSDFTHFSTMAVAKGVTCHYGQSLGKIKIYYPQKKDRKFIIDFLKNKKIAKQQAKPLYLAKKPLDCTKIKIIGGHLSIFTFMQSQLKINLKNRYLYLEYHSGAQGESIEDLLYFIDQLLYLIKKNLPRGFVLGNTSLKNMDGSRISIKKINKALIEKLKNYRLPIYYLDHFKNIIKFS